MRSVWVGFDARESAAFAVTRHSIRRTINTPIPVRGIILDDVRRRNLYYRPTERIDLPSGNNVLIDVISEHPMATEFAISRFLTPHLARETMPSFSERWALFMDCDMLVRHDIGRLFDQRDPTKAVQVVKHDFRPKNTTKMDGQVQSQYSRKNWSSVILFNVDHPANQRLTVDLINNVPGRDLHGFCWLEDHEIGELDIEWNYLVGFHTVDDCLDPAIVHFTDGIPTMAGYEDCDYADEWRRSLNEWSR
jgi:hypothetical protein